MKSDNNASYFQIYGTRIAVVGLCCSSEAFEFDYPLHLAAPSDLWCRLHTFQIPPITKILTFNLNLKPTSDWSICDCISLSDDIFDEVSIKWSFSAKSFCCFSILSFSCSTSLESARFNDISVSVWFSYSRIFFCATTNSSRVFLSSSDRLSCF